MYRHTLLQLSNGRGKRAFTLVELLVVIGIIALLLAILLPSLARARQSANSVACQSNLRQIALWAFMYAETWKGVLPHNGTTDFVNGVGYYHLSTDTWSDKFIKEMLGGRYQRSGTVLHCPQVMGSIGYLRDHNAVACTYSINIYLGGDWRERNAVTFAGQTRNGAWYYTPSVPKVRHLSPDKFWFTDGRVSFYNGWQFDSRVDMILKSGNRFPWPYRPVKASSNPTFEGHPNQSANFVFGDGHAESIPYKEFLSRYYGAPPNTTHDAWMTFTGAPAGYPGDSF